MSSILNTRAMNQKLNGNLVNAVKNALPEKTNIAMYLMDLLSLGKEAVYRRLRGTVSFNIEESALISRDLNISLDHIVGMKSTEKAIFNLNLIQRSNMMDDYCGVMENYIKALRRIKVHPDAKIQSACNALPCLFYMEYELIAKFYLYKWAYQMRGFENTLSFSQFVVPQNVTDINRELVQESCFIKSSSFVLSRDIFISLAKDIALFSRLNLLTKSESQQIKMELVDLLYNIESTAASGIWNLDNNVSGEVLFYLSNIGFESSYTYLECSDFELSIFQVFSYGSINSFKSYVCQIHREWIESLKRSSTLISRSGDVHRAEYFNEQRELLNTIL